MRSPAAPRLVACYFNTRHDAADQWSRMAAVLSSTARAHCPTWEVVVNRITPSPAKAAGGSIAYEANTQKLDYWAAAVAGAPDGIEMLLMDVDTFVVRPLDDIFDGTHFDFAYTERETGASLFPLNAGVILVRVSERVRAFMELWRSENRKMLTDPLYHRPWNRKYAGINQAALGKVLESRAAADLGVAVARLPCAEWNCEDSAWTQFDPARTRIVHLKSALRLAVFAMNPTPPHLRPLVTLWRELERAAQRRRTKESA